MTLVRNGSRSTILSPICDPIDPAQMDFNDLPPLLTKGNRHEGQARSGLPLLPLVSQKVSFLHSLVGRNLRTGLTNYAALRNYSPLPSSQVDIYSGFSYSSAWLVRFNG